jgi:hypothetical protein
MGSLRDNIESIREKLYILILNKGLTDSETIICSQELDEL